MYAGDGRTGRRMIVMRDRYPVRDVPPRIVAERHPGWQRVHDAVTRLFLRDGRTAIVLAADRAARRLEAEGGDPPRSVREDGGVVVFLWACGKTVSATSHQEAS